MRQLASVQRIKAVRPIEGADKIEVADILGWHVVVQKGQFTEGDLCVYCEIDSILPAENEVFAFLEGQRIKTKKLRGVVSQGIAFPIYPLLSDYTDRITEDTDVTEFLKVKKYEPPEPHHKEEKTNKAWYMNFALGRWIYFKFFYKPSRGAFPAWIKKTDETRVQILGDILERHKGIKCSVAEKVDGSSITMWMENGKLHVCSRNTEILNEDDVFYKTAMEYINCIRELPDKTVIQGELLGEGIQGNKYKLKGHCIKAYNMISRTGEMVAPNDFYSICAAIGMPTVPQLENIELSDNVDEIVAMAEGVSKLANIQREGIVIRPLTPVGIYGDKRFIYNLLSFKAINPKFLLKFNE